MPIELILALISILLFSVMGIQDYRHCEVDAILCYGVAAVSIAYAVLDQRWIHLIIIVVLTILLALPFEIPIFGQADYCIFMHLIGAWTNRLGYFSDLMFAGVFVLIGSALYVILLRAFSKRGWKPFEGTPAIPCYAIPLPFMYLFIPTLSEAYIQWMFAI